MSNHKDAAINEILDLLTQSHSSSELVKGVASTLAQVIPFDRFSLGLAQLRYWFYFQDGQITSERSYYPFDENSSASAWVLLHQEPCLRNDTAAQHQFTYDTVLQDEQMRSDLILPLKIDNTPIGTFNFTKREPNYYNQTHLDLALEITNLMNLCAKRILDDLDQKAIENITQQLQETTNIDTILKAILEHLHGQYDRIRIYLCDNKTNTLRGRYQIDETGFTPITNRNYPFESDPFTQQTIKSELPQIYSVKQLNHKKWLESIEEQSISQPLGNQEWAEIALKIQNGDKEQIIGKISLDNNTTQIPLIQDTLNHQMVFIRQAAIAIWQTELYQQMSEQVTQRTQQLSATNHQLEQKDKLLTALQEVSHHSFSYLNQDAILDNFAERIIQAGIFRSLMISVVDHESDTVEVVRAFQRELPEGPFGPVKIVNYENTCGTRYHINDDNITPLTVRTGQMQTADTKSDKRLDARFEQDQNWDDKIAYFIPIKREERVIALLATATTREEKKGFLDHLKTMAPIFDQLGIALEHAKLFQRARTTEAHYRSLFENMQSGFAYRQLIFDDKGVPVDYIFLDTNQAYADLYGLSSKDVVGKTITQLYSSIKKDPHNLYDRYIEVATTGQAIRIEIPVPALEKWFDVSVYSPQKGYFATVSHDITERKNSEEKLAELLDFQVKMLDTPAVWICAFDNDRKMIFWNRGAELISGYSSKTIVGSADVWELLFPDSDYFQEYVKSTTERLESTGHIENVESIIQCKDGTAKTISWYANRLINNEGEQVGFLAIGLDITHHKQLETEIVRLERLKALGELAAGVSHNLNNMLTGILLPAAMLKNTNLSTTALENVEDIFLSATRARDLVAQLNQSVRKDNTDLLEPVDVNRAIAEAVRATRARWKDESESNGLQIQLNMQLHATNPAQATMSGLHDVLINLIFNAIDALPNGGEITITSNMYLTGVQLTIEDNGIGMSSDTQLKVFEPFFTTKMDVGTGLGLSTAYSQVQRWGGTLTVKSELGQGTQFTIDLPPWTDTLVSEKEPPTPTTTAQRILIVEDDPMIRRALNRYLSDIHNVTITENGQQALDAVVKNTFDLAIIDLGLPDMPGDELARQLKQKAPHLPAILMTGWALPDNDPRKSPFQFHIQKPIIEPEALLTAIEQITNKSAG